MATQYTAGLTAGQILTAATMNSIGAAWETFTPVISQGATITKTTGYSKYSQVNKLVTFAGQFTLTSAGTVSNDLQVTLPINNNNPSTTGVVGSAIFFDASAPRFYTLVVAPASAGLIKFIYDNTAAYFGQSPAVTVANTDQLSFTVTYEAV